jgi:phosphate transport system permease protein
MLAYVLLFLGLASGFAAMLAYSRARSVLSSPGDKAHSRPVYHALNAAIWTGIPAFVMLVGWLFLHDNIIDAFVLAKVPGADLLEAAQRSLLLSEIRQTASGNAFSEIRPEVAAGAEHYKKLVSIANAVLVVAAASLAVLGAFFGYRVIARRFAARHSVERSVTWFMMFSSLVAILTTVVIIVSLVYEAGAFFALVPIQEFLFGLRWEPQIALRADQVAGQGAFGVVPVIFGTFVISALAMLVAVPVGVYSAIYLTEYARPSVRSVIKPVLEILAGIPTVVYGFFAVLTVAPMVRTIGLSLGLDAAPNSALAAGGVMGVMIIPFISSIADDALASVPRSMRDGSYALGATKSETITRVLLPAALPGIVGGVLLALSRAVGETMIVVMAAGLIATMTLNPFESVTTVTVQIVTLLIGDSEFDNPKTLAAFALGLVLFVITLCLNLIALHTVRKYREKY